MTLAEKILAERKSASRPKAAVRPRSAPAETTGYEAEDRRIHDAEAAADWMWDGESAAQYADAGRQASAAPRRQARDDRGRAAFGKYTQAKAMRARGDADIRLQKCVSPVFAVKRFFADWTIRGRSSRSEYWWATFCVSLAMGVLDGMAANSALAVFTGVLHLILLWPTFCLWARRCHDIGWPAWVVAVQFFAAPATVVVSQFVK